MPKKVCLKCILQDRWLLVMFSFRAMNFTHAKPNGVNGYVGFTSVTTFSSSYFVIWCEQNVIWYIISYLNIRVDSLTTFHCFDMSLLSFPLKHSYCSKRMLHHFHTWNRLWPLSIHLLGDLDLRSWRLKTKWIMVIEARHRALSVNYFFREGSTISKLKKVLIAFSSDGLHTRLIVLFWIIGGGGGRVVKCARHLEIF